MNRLTRIIIVTLIGMIIIILFTPSSCGAFVHGKTNILRRAKCYANMLSITEELKEYLDKHKQYPNSLEGIISDKYDKGVFKCTVSKNQNNNEIDYDYFIDSSNNIILYEKENHHYIGRWAFGLKAYNARHVLIFDGKNKDIKLYSDDDFKVLLDKHQLNPDKENK